ncbi:hypothetical protein KEJ50_02010 [Candidatus Bathyarchaeota archaeon]|nr:hypothetical protein [Candidatus Bathyarchaeota archaeon]
MNMNGKKIKIEFFDNDGVKHVIALEGTISREKITKIIDYVELMGGAYKNENSSPIPQNNNKFERIKRLLLYNFSDKIFVSKDVQKAYFEVYGESLSLSTVSTYLSRLVDKNFLVKTGSSGEWHYALVKSDIIKEFKTQFNSV